MIHYTPFWAGSGACDLRYLEGWTSPDGTWYLVGVPTRGGARTITLFLQWIKEGCGCADCGRRGPYWWFDFDHVPERGLKFFSLSRPMRQGGLSFAAVESELMKCDVVCKLCHADRTQARSLDR